MFEGIFIVQALNRTTVELLETNWMKSNRIWTCLGHHGHGGYGSGHNHGGKIIIGKFALIKTLTKN